MSPIWQYRRPQPLSSHKDQQLDSCPWTNTALGEFWSPANALQQHSKTKDLRITAQKEKEESFILPASSRPPSWNFSAPRGNFPSRKSSPHQERKSRMREQLLQPLGHHTNVPLPGAAKQWAWSRFIVTCSATNPADFATEETNGQHSHRRPLQISPASNSLMPHAWVPPRSLGAQHH